MFCSNPNMHRLMKREKEANTSVRKCKTTWRSCSRRIPNQHQLIWSYFKISKSTYSRLKKSVGHAEHAQKISRRDGTISLLSESAKELLKTMVESPKRPISIKGLQHKVFELLSEDDSDIAIRRFLREELRFAYK